MVLTVCCGGGGAWGQGLSGGPVEGAAWELLGPAACALPLPLWPPALFSGNTDQGGRGEMSEQVAGSPACTSLPQLCPRPRVTFLQGDRNSVLREGSPVKPGRDRASRLGAAVFHLGGLRMAVCRKQPEGWCVSGGGETCLSSLSCSLLAQPALLSEPARLMGSSSRSCKDVCGLGTLGAGGWKHKGLVGIGETAAAH